MIAVLWYIGGICWFVSGYFQIKAGNNYLAYLALSVGALDISAGLLQP